MFEFPLFFHCLLADDSASASQPVSLKESSKASLAVEDESGVTAASSSTPMYALYPH